MPPVPTFSDDPPQPPPSFRGEPSLPLFGRVDDDVPLVTLPAEPRQPLAVRRTPATPRLKTVARQTPRLVEEPALDFAHADLRPPSPSVELPPAGGAPESGTTTTVRRAGRPVRTGVEAAIGGARTNTVPTNTLLTNTAAWQTSSAGRRLGAAAVDHMLLGVIDVLVVYFTLSILGLTMDDWRLLPVLPMLAFLGLLSFAYFTLFTSVGGQTIGKMAMSIRVVGDDDRTPDPACAVRRSLAGAVSVLSGGLTFLPALFAPDGRALHDRAARTRVVALPSS